MDDFYVFLSSDASEKLYPDNTKACFTTKLAEPIELSPFYTYEVALCEVIFPGSKEIDVADGAKRENVFLYTDVSEPVRVADSSSRLLRVICPDLVHQKFVDRYYVPIATYKIDTIRVLLTTRLGEKYPFKSGLDPLIIVLHFRTHP